MNRAANSLAALRGLAALFAVGLALRLQLTVIGPLLPSIQEDVAIAHATAGLLTALPLLCMGLAAFVTGRIVDRLGASMAVGGALALVAVAGLLRAVAPEPLPIFGATLLIGVGIGVGGASVPVFVKHRFAGRPAGATGVHVTAIILGSVIVASTAVPVAHALGSWRWPLAVSSTATLVSALVWLALTAGTPAGRRPTEGRGVVPWRSPVAWLLVMVFCLQSLIFFGLATWLPAAYVERGWSEAAAGSLVALLIATGLPASFGVGWLSDRTGSRRPYLTGSALTALVACIGFVALPDAAVVWAAAAGVALGALFALVLTLPLDASPSPAAVGPLTGMMLGVGYLVAAVAPVVMGAARDAIGTFSASLGLLAVAAATLVGLSTLATDARLAARRASAVAAAANAAADANEAGVPLTPPSGRE